MRRKTILWLALTALVVAVSALLPEAALRIQDARLEGAVQSQAVETVDLSLLAELSVEDTLYLVQTYQSRVMLDQGRQMNRDQAGRAALEGLERVYEWNGYSIDMTVTDATPWLYVGQGGESVVLWQVTAAGQSVNPLWSMVGPYMEYPMRRTDAMALVDERSGQVVSMDVRWSEDEMASAVEPTTVPYEPGEAAMDPAEDRDIRGFSNAVSYTLLWAMADSLGFREVPDSVIQEDAEGRPYLALTCDDGTAFAVQAQWDMNGMRFN